MLSDLLHDLATEVGDDLGTSVEIVELDVLDPSKLVPAVPQWHATDDAVSA